MRRAIEITAALLIATVLLPVLVLVAVALLLNSGPPVLFRQQRVGRDGREFRIAKFRTMRPATGPEDEDDDAGRSTRLGRFLRTTSIDELPQLWNILRGDMGFIGPRPTLPDQVARYSDHERRRHEVRPGITGWAQVNGRNALSWPERIELDIWYVDHRSALVDLRILVRTVGCLVRPSGVMGEGGINPDFPTTAEESASAPLAAEVPAPRPVRRLDAGAPAREGAAS